MNPGTIIALVAAGVIVGALVGFLVRRFFADGLNTQGKLSIPGIYGEIFQSFLHFYLKYSQKGIY